MNAGFTTSPLRVCGGCTLCCQAPAITPLGKPCGVRCELLVDGGCGVYAHRDAPEFKDCVSFTCLWLQGWSEIEDRPDKIGVIFMGKDDPDRPGQIRVQVAETAPGAAQNPRVQELIGQVLKEGRTVAITNAQYVIAIRPAGDSWRYAIDSDDPLHGRVDPRVAPVQLTARGRALKEE